MQEVFVEALGRPSPGAITGGCGTDLETLPAAWGPSRQGRNSPGKGLNHNHWPNTSGTISFPEAGNTGKLGFPTKTHTLLGSGDRGDWCVPMAGPLRWPGVDNLSHWSLAEHRQKQTTPQTVIAASKSQTHPRERLKNQTDQGGLSTIFDY